MTRVASTRTKRPRPFFPRSDDRLIAGMVTTARPPRQIGVDTPTIASSTRRLRTPTILVALCAFGAAAVVGAYLDWILWVDYEGLLITALAAIIVLVGGLMTLVGRGIWRRIGAITLVVGIGLIAGQNLGPSREPMIFSTDGTMTLRLESPVVAVATGSADCTNVASGTEFAVAGTSATRLETPEHHTIDVYLNVGDRWEAIDNGISRKDGVRLDLMATAAKIQDDGSPSMVVMGLTDSSTLESSFSNAGGSLRFGGLVAQPRDGFTGPPVDLAGTLEWTCGAIPG
jgi:hypothetical protein